MPTVPMIAPLFESGSKMRVSNRFLAKRGTAHGSGLGAKRWVVERTIAWLHQFRRLRIRYERHGYMHRAFLSLAASIIMSRFL